MTWPQSLRRVIEVAGVEVRLSPQEHAIAELILMSNGPITMAALVESLWPDPDEEPELPETQLQVMVHRLRTKGIPVRSHRGFGYSLNLPDLMPLTVRPPKELITPSPTKTRTRIRTRPELWPPGYLLGVPWPPPKE